MAASDQVTLAAVGTFYRRYENTLPLLRRVLVEGDPPDETWLLCETTDDRAAVDAALQQLGRQDDPTVTVEVVPTPMVGNSYQQVPYAVKHNWALDRSPAGAFVYLDNGAMPSPDKHRLMRQALTDNPDWGAVFCSQHRTGYRDELFMCPDPIPDAYCVLNVTQVAHRATDARWSTDMRTVNLGDAHFWRELHARFGDFHPIPDLFVHDTHHIPSPSAVTDET